MRPPSTSRTIFAALGIFVLALAVRLPRMSQSLWYDEMYTLVEYVAQPWQKVLAAHPGEYVPNNHVLYTMLAKLIYRTNEDQGPNEALLRVPALIAGCLLPIALAWPLRRTSPWTALLLAIVACLHPWLIAFSTEARGYSLLLLLGVLATNLLPDGRRRWPIGYALMMAAAIYTMPIAVVLLVAHGVAMAVLRRDSFSAWGRAAGLSVVLSGLIYLPMGRAMVQYYRQPYETTITYREFLDELPRFALAGERLPQQSLDILRLPDSFSGSVYWALPVLVILIGSAFAWSSVELRLMVVSIGIVSVLGILSPLINSGTTEVRFVPWAAVWFCVGVVAILVSAKTRGMRGVAMVGVVLLLTWMGLRDAAMPANQPIREGIRLADHLAPTGYDLMVGYLGAREAAYLYGDESAGHLVLAGHDSTRWIAGEQRAISETGHLPWVVIFYEDLARRRNEGAEDGRGLWVHLMKNYRLVTRLPGRVSAVGIYEPKEEGNVAFDVFRQNSTLFGFGQRVQITRFN
jgi:hypothetical protein